MADPERVVGWSRLYLAESLRILTLIFYNSLIVRGNNAIFLGAAQRCACMCLSSESKFRRFNPVKIPGYKTHPYPISFLGGVLTNPTYGSFIRSSLAEVQRTSSKRTCALAGFFHSYLSSACINIWLIEVVCILVC